MIYIYDGTFEGFLSAIFEIYTYKTKPVNIVSALSEVQMSIDVECYYVKTEEEKADRVMAGMNKISDEFSNKVIFAFLSWMPGREMIIYHYIAMGFKMKENIFLKLNDDIVRSVNDMSNQTGTEKQKIKGFLRFSVMENDIYYAEISPKNNVLSLIMPHFCRRMDTTPFLVHDLTYKQVGLYNTKEWDICPSDGFTLPPLHSNELKYRYMWKLFYDTTAMDGRINLARRQQMIPKRYQKHITELQEHKVYLGM